MDAAQRVEVKGNLRKMSNLIYTNPGTFVRADAREVLSAAPPADFVFLDPPYEDIELIREILKVALALRDRGRQA